MVNNNNNIDNIIMYPIPPPHVFFSWGISTFTQINTIRLIQETREVDDAKKELFIMGHKDKVWSKAKRDA